MKTYHLTVVTLAGDRYELAPLSKEELDSFEENLFPNSQLYPHLLDRIVVLTLSDKRRIVLVTPRSVSSLEAYDTGEPAPEDPA